MSDLHPTRDQIERIAKAADDGPLVMLNLIKFRDRSGDGDGTGRDAYQRYSDAVLPLVEARGGTVLWVGEVAQVVIGDDHGDDWDRAILVQYPSRAAFLDMATSKDYAAINHHRLDGLAKHVILATSTSYTSSPDA